MWKPLHMWQYGEVLCGRLADSFLRNFSTRDDTRKRCNARTRVSLTNWTVGMYGAVPSQGLRAETDLTECSVYYRLNTETAFRGCCACRLLVHLLTVPIKLGLLNGSNETKMKASPIKLAIKTGKYWLYCLMTTA